MLLRLIPVLEKCCIGRAAGAGWLFFENQRNGSVLGAQINLIFIICGARGAPEKCTPGHNPMKTEISRIRVVLSDPLLYTF